MAGNVGRISLPLFAFLDPLGTRQGKVYKRRKVHFLSLKRRQIRGLKRNPVSYGEQREPQKEEEEERARPECEIRD